MSDEHKPWPRVKFRKLNGEIGVRIAESSDNTLTVIKHEAPIVMDELRKAGGFVARLISRKEYLDKVSAFIDERKNADDYTMLISEIRKTFPGLDGHIGRFVISDAGLKELEGLKNLTELFLGGTKITDAGLKELSGFKNLTHLGLGGTRITDAGLKELGVLKNLKWLSLGGTKITDAGLKELRGLNNLEALSIIATHVTDVGVTELRKTLPTVGISR